MANCGFCKRGMSTSLEEITPRGSRYKLTAVCCGSCGAVLSVLDFHNIGQMMNELKGDVARLGERLAALSSQEANNSRALVQEVRRSR